MRLRVLMLFDVATLHGHAEFVAAVSFTSDGDRLVSVDTQWTVRLWDGEARQQVP